MLQYKNVDIHLISQRLGHRSIKITPYVYAHMMKEYRFNEDGKIKNIFEELNNSIIARKK
ncbi:hypothetical protein EQJ87_01860 [Lactococcus kimchii]|nr:hypothetical protein EQJ87_01860 [Lactococcus sp. S-13]